MHTPGPWTYEASTKTVRSEPANYWLASMDSWDGAVDNEANARLIASAPELLAALERSEQYIICAIYDGKTGAQRLSKETIALAESDLEMVRAAIAKAKAGKG